MEIFRLNAEDWKVYKDLRLEALLKNPEAFGASYDDEIKKSDEGWKEKAEMLINHIFVACEGDDYFGMVFFYQEQKEKIAHIAYVGGVYVRETHRGQGAGKKLMQAVLDEIQKNSTITKINLNVNTKQIAAIRLYESFGFQNIGTLHRELKVNGEYFDEYAMEKLL